jgi:hypothetical protein
VALGAWATQRSDPDFTTKQTTHRISSCLPLGNNDIAIAKKREKLNKERKERFRRGFVVANGQEQTWRLEFFIFWRVAVPRFSL